MIFCTASLVLGISHKIAKRLSISNPAFTISIESSTTYTLAIDPMKDAAAPKVKMRNAQANHGASLKKYVKLSEKT